MKYRISLIFGLMALTSCFRDCRRAEPYNLYQTDLSPKFQNACATSAVSCGEEFCGPWWLFFQDEQLNRLIEGSLALHPNIHIAEARIRRAYDEAMVARSRLFPHIFGIADLKKQKISSFGEGFVPQLPTTITQTTLELASAVFEVDIWKKNRSLYRGALSQVQAACAEAAEVRLLLGTTIASIYFDLQMKIERKRVTEERLAAREELYDLHLQQFNLGIIPEFRLFEVDTDVEMLRDLLFQLEGEIAVDENALSALVGNVVPNGCGRLVTTPSALFNHPFPLPSTLPIDLLGRRPDVVAEKWRVESACYNIHAAKANFFPRIDLIGWIGTQSIFIEKLFTGKTLIGLAEGVATLPIFLAGKLKAELGIAREDLEIAINQYNQTILLAVQQVSDALSNLKAADARKNAVEIAYRDALSLLNLTQQKYSNGIINKLTVLNAVENALVQKDLIVQIELDRFEAAVDLIQAIGGGYHEGT